MAKSAPQHQPNKSGKDGQSATPHAYIPRLEEIAEMDRHQLERESARLRTMLARMRGYAGNRAQLIGLLSRGRFIEHAIGEFNNARRDKRDLSLLVATVTGGSPLLNLENNAVAGQTAKAAAKIIARSTGGENVILGRIAPDRIAALLPNTGTSACNKHLKNIQLSLTQSPIVAEDKAMDIGLNIAGRTMTDSHGSFLEMLVSI